MKCTQCEFYSRQLFRCKLGKANPPSKKKAMEVANFMGTGYICNKNDHKQAVIAELGNSPGII